MIGRFQQLFVLAIQQGKKKPEDWAAFVAQILTAQGQKIVKEGKPLETPEEHLAELTTQAHDFATKQLPIRAVTKGAISRVGVWWGQIFWKSQAPLCLS